MADPADPQPPGRGKLVMVAVLVTTLFWTVVWGGFALVRGRPQPVAFAVQPPPATATPAPTATPVPPPENTATPVPTAIPATAATVAPRSGAVVLDSAAGDVAPEETEGAAGAISDTLPARNTAAILVNINTAAAAELESLPGIGPKTAEAIIAYRDEHGPFASIEAITEVKGIGPATLEKLRALITID